MPEQPKTKKPSARPSGKPAPVNRRALHKKRRMNRKKKLYRKSRQYQVRQQKIFLICSVVGSILLLIAVALIARACSSPKAETVSKDSDAENMVSMVADEGAAGSPKDAGEKPVSLTVSVVGDCTLGTDEYFDYETSLNAYFDYGADYYFRNVRSIFENDDLTIANNEGTFTTSTTREDKQFAFKGSPEFARIYSSSSVEAVTTANNHSHDYGEQSFTDTMNALDKEGVVHFGYDETAVVDIKGVKVGLVGIYELNDHLGRTQQLKDNIAKVKADGAELVIVIFHWGNEKEEAPDENQMTLGRLAIDEGADLVCGHHPHVLQGIETYKGKNIVYSLGNFCFGGNSYPSDMDSMIFQQTFTLEKGKVKADNETRVIPVSISSDYGYNNYQPTPSEGEEAARILNKIDERSSYISLTGDSTAWTQEQNRPNEIGGQNIENH